MTDVIDWIKIGLTVAGIVLTVLIPILVSLFNTQKHQAKELSDHKTHVAETYATKDDMKDLGDRIERQMKDGFNNLKELLINRKDKDAA